VSQGYLVLVPDDRPLPDQCEQGECQQPVETWCPLCERFLCKPHDELTPTRRHDCLRGKAEVV